MPRQPIDALKPSAFSIEAAEKWALERAGELPSEPFRITACFHIDFILQQVPHERKTRYIARMAQSGENYGLAERLAPGPPALHPDFVGKDVRRILTDRLRLDRIDRTAFVDLVMGHLLQSANEANKHVTLEGSIRDTHFQRGRIFAEEAETIIHHKGVKGNDPRALVIGATGGIISALINRGFGVSATDLSPAIVGRTLGGVKICNGRFANASLMKKTDLAIITGMALSNGTLSGLMELAKKYNTSTMIWAITGKNFGRYYTEHGADCVISDLAGFQRVLRPVSMGIWRRKI
jgi:hypothetical protein